MFDKIEEINNNFNKKNFPTKNLHSKILEKDIKILIKYILFNKDLKDGLVISKIAPFYKLISNCYLTNTTLWYKYKSYFFYQKLINIIEKETKYYKPFNNKAKNSDENLINKIYNSLIEFLSSNQDYYNENQANAVMKNLEVQDKFKITYDNHNYNEILTNFPENFEIIDEFVYQDLLIRNKFLFEDNYLKTEIIINSQNIIIKPETNEKEGEKNYILLIGNIENDIFYLKYVIIFSEENNRQEFFKSFIKNSFDKIMDANEIYFTFDNYSQNQKFIYFNDNKINFDEKHINDKIIKLFLFLYLFQDEIDENLKKSIKDNGIQFYYLINEQWMKLYKEYYEYKELCTHFERMKNNKLFNYNYKQLKECLKQNNYEKSNEFIFQLIKEIPYDVLEKLEKKKKNQNKLIEELNTKAFSINKKLYEFESENSFKYHMENEIISLEIINIFNILETDIIKDAFENQIEKIECLIGENKLFIKTENETNNSLINYNVINIGLVNNCIFKPFLLIYYYEKSDLNKFISYLNSNDFSKFVQQYNIIDNSYCDIKNSEKKKIGKICKIDTLPDEIKNMIQNLIIINSESIKLLKFVIYYIKLFKEKTTSIKDKKEQIGYFVKMDFLEKIQELKVYKIINEYIKNDKDIQDLLNNNLKLNIEELTELLTKKFDLDIIKEINEEKTEINIYSSSYNVDLVKVKLDKNIDISCPNDFFLLSKEIYNLFKGWAIFDNYSSNYLIGEDKMFIINNDKNNILIYNIEEKNRLNLELILYFDQYNNSFLEQIKDIGFNEFLKYNYFDNSNKISPIFDNNEKRIGHFYKYSPSTQDYNNDFNVFIEMKKIIKIYLNYKEINIENDNTFNEYYILNKNWIQIYKNYYDYDDIYNEIEKNLDIKKLINELKNNEKNDELISDKKLFFLYKNFSDKIVNNFIKKEKDFIEKYKNTETKTPQILGLEYLNEKNESSTVFYYNNFEIINSKNYEYLFQKLDNEIEIPKTFFLIKKSIKNEAEKVLCLFDKNRIIIRLIKNNLLSDKKCILYIGHLDSSYTFEIECLLLYENISLMEEHIKIIMDSIGFNDFCEQFLKAKINIKKLLIGNKAFGTAIKKNQIKEYDLNCGDNDLVSKYFTFPPKVGMDKIGKNNGYINAILQCFCQIEEFASYFKYHSHVNEVINDFTKERKNFLSSSFKILIEKLWPDDIRSKESSQRHFSPSELVQKIEDMSPLFNNDNSNNVVDFINFIIITLHEELNQKIISNNINPFLSKDMENNYNFLNSFNQFYNEFGKNFNSKISELFYAIQQTHIQCLNCGNNQYNFQAFFLISFPLEDIKKYLINMNSNKSINNINNELTNENNININVIKDTKNENQLKLEKLNKNIIDLLDCFEYNQRKVILKNDDRIFCNFCNQITDTSYTSSFVTLPKILILLLDRGKDFHSEIKLEFNLTLNLTEYNMQKNKDINYSLISVLSYFKENENENNWVAHCLSPIDYHWYTYNNSKINKINDVKKEILDSEIPYLLFYKKIE